MYSGRRGEGTRSIDIKSRLKIRLVLGRPSPRSPFDVKKIDIWFFNIPDLGIHTSTEAFMMNNYFFLNERKGLPIPLAIRRLSDRLTSS